MIINRIIIPNSQLTYTLQNQSYIVFVFLTMPDEPRVHKYAIWAVPPDDVSERIKKVMDGLREEFGGPEIRPHIPIMASIHSDHESIVKKFREKCTGVSYDCKIERVNTSPCAFYYQCVYLFIDPEVSFYSFFFTQILSIFSCFLFSYI